MMDAVFGGRNFRNEIVWCYKDRERPLNQWNRKHDIIFYYTKDVNVPHIFNWASVAEKYSDVTLSKFKYKDEIGVFRIRGHNIKGSPYRAQTDLKLDTLENHPELVYKDSVVNQRNGTLFEPNTFA
jgi:adenine specific DNA methylase Mod